MKKLIVLFCIINVSGCVFHIPIKQMPTNSEIVEMSHEQLSCDKAKIVVVHRRNDIFTRDWELSCGSTLYFCEMTSETTAICDEK